MDKILKASYGDRQQRSENQRAADAALARAALARKQEMKGLPQEVRPIKGP